jgi:hypothetical protein
VAAYNYGFHYGDSKLWVRFDSYLYEDIARHGYTLYSCARVHNFRPADWCGNAGWFPGYPALLSLLERAGLRGAAVGVTISTAFEFATLALLWNGLLRNGGTARSFLLLLCAAFFFGQVYQHAVFPISMELFFLLLTLRFAHRGQWWGAGLAGAAAACTYSIGFLLIPALGLWILIDPSTSPARTKAKAFVISCGLTLLGYLTVMLVQRIDTGVWGAFFMVQAKYGYSGLHSPIAKLSATLRPLLRRGLGWHTVPALQTVLVSVFCLTLVATATWYRKRLDRLDRLALATTLCFWLFPLAIGADVHLYRSEALLMPGLLMMRRVPLAVHATVLAILVPLSYAMTVLFFRRILI